MDAESETLVQDALSVLLKDKTVMVIAHRMRTVRMPIRLLYWMMVRSVRWVPQQN